LKFVLQRFRPLPPVKSWSKEAMVVISRYTLLVNSFGIVITLNHVTEVIEETSKRELYGIVPFRVHEHFINDFVTKWESISLDSFNEVEKILSEVVGLFCSKHFSRFQSSGLSYEVM
jgi:hypothetical protein